MKRALVAVACALLAGGAHAVLDVEAMWDYARPAESEARFRARLPDVKGDDALVLRTQIARSYSLRGRIDDAHRELDMIEPQLPTADGVEPRVRTLLERGRTLREAKQPVQARALFQLAFETADRAKLEFLAGDALHMAALVEPTLEGQLEWHRRTIDYARAAHDPKARRWDAIAFNNLGVTLRRAGRHADALAAFEQSLVAYRRDGSTADERIARWHIAHELRRLGKVDDALERQLALERELAAAGESDPYVYEELALLHDAKGDAAKASRYRELQRKAKGE
jgi:tetratricopeptide (TPR) repeat protein